MFESGIERTVILTGVVLWFAHGWYLNERLKLVHDKLDTVLDQFNGLREYLYAIDPQFDDERASRRRFDGMSDLELIRDKERAGKRTLNRPF